MNPNTAFELFTQRICQKIEGNRAYKNSHVQHNVKLKGKSGCSHQIDVYWVYEEEGELRHIIIECKNYNSKIKIGQVRDFYGVVSDLGNVHGIMVSSKGYQDGAKKFADYYGISLKGLRRPRWNESIGTITTIVQVNPMHCYYLIDTEWIKEHNFDLERLRQRYASLQFEKADYWHNATHFPIESIDYIIRDSLGNPISSIEGLEQQLPENPEPGATFVFPFEDGWLNSRYWGLVKIREVMFEFESKTHKTTMNLAADDFVVAIIEDALSGKTDYVPKY